MDSDEEKEPIIKERLILDDNSSDSQRGAFSEIFKKTRKNRSGLQAKEERQTNNNQNADLSAFGKLFLTSPRGRLILFEFYQ
jgi:dTDP-4-dehydrorhamnose 3,5-epimerase-like enzyme